MKKMTVALSIASLLTLAAPAAQAQNFLNRLVPGAATSSAAATDPDAFLAETIETTKLMTTAAVILAAAAENRQSRDELKAAIDGIQNKNTVGELQATRALLSSSVDAIKANAGSAEQAQALYDNATAEQQQQLLSAAFNFSLGLVRNVQLAQQSPTLIQSIASNPMMIMKLNSLRQAGQLIAVQGQAAASMWTPLRAILARGGVQEPQEASATEPRPIAI